MNRTKALSVLKGMFGQRPQYEIPCVRLFSVKSLATPNSGEAIGGPRRRVHGWESFPSWRNGRGSVGMNCAHPMCLAEPYWTSVVGQEGIYR